MIDCIDECPFLTHCPTCGSCRDYDDDEDINSMADVEGYPLCYFCNIPIKPSEGRAFIEKEDTCLIICGDCIYGGVTAGELPYQLLKELN